MTEEYHYEGGAGLSETLRKGSGSATYLRCGRNRRFANWRGIRSPPLDSDAHQLREALPDVLVLLLLAILEHLVARRTDPAVVVAPVDVVRPVLVPVERAHDALVRAQLVEQAQEHGRAHVAARAALGERLVEERERRERVRLHEVRAPEEAAPDVVLRELLGRAVLAREAADELRRAEHAAAHERGGEERVRARQAREVDDADRVHGGERGRARRVDARPGVEGVDEELAEVVECALHDAVDLVLVSEADAGGDGVEGEVVRRYSGITRSGQARVGCGWEG